MSAEDWADIEYVPTFLQSSSWEEKIGSLSKAQLLLIAEYLDLKIVEGTKKGVLLLKVVDTIRSSNMKKMKAIYRMSCYCWINSFNYKS